MRNGTIVLKYNGFDFIDRNDKPESFFRDLYPTHCMDFPFTMDLYHNNNIQETAPCFYHYMKSLVPEKSDNSELP